MKAAMRRSFEVIFYDPEARSHQPWNFTDLPSEQRIEYLEFYAKKLTQFYEVGPDALASTVVSEDEARQRAALIKDPPEPKVRKIVPLKYWRWRLEGEAVGDQSWVKPEYEDTFWNEVDCPFLASYDQALWLRSTAVVERPSRLLLHIDSIIDTYRIWVNGRVAFEHSGPEPVVADVTDFARAGTNFFAIRVENKEREQVGISGSIALHHVTEVHITQCFVATTSVGRPSRADVEIKVAVSNSSSEDFSGKLVVCLCEWFPTEAADPSACVSDDVHIAAGTEREITFTATLRSARLWSPDTPNLYRVAATLLNGAGEAVDDIADVCGIRTLSVKGGRLELNGKPFFLKSFGHNLGFPPAVDFHGTICPPDHWIVRDVLLAKRANANGLRLHPWGFSGELGKYNKYAWPEWGWPCDATDYGRIAAIADQLGLCLIWPTRHWTLWTGKKKGGFERNYDEAAYATRLKASIRRVRNHPSIVAYEGLNEVGAAGNWNLQDSPPEKAAPIALRLQEKYRRFTRRYPTIVREADPTRWICPDSPWHPEHKWCDRAWYEEEPARSENLYFSHHNYIGWNADLGAHRKLHDLYWPAGKRWPVILAECGAEAMPDWSRYRGERWYGIWLNNGRPSAQIEQDRLGRPLRVLRDSEVHISQAYQALCIQQTATYVRMTRADGMNINLIADGLAQGLYHKGVCDLYRKAKLGFYAARAGYQDIVVSATDGKFVMSSEGGLIAKLAADPSTTAGKSFTLKMRITDAAGAEVEAVVFQINLDEAATAQAPGWMPRLVEKGLYAIEYYLEES